MTVRTVCTALGATAVGGVAGLLTRPCCTIPAALSIAGVGSTGLGDIFITHRALFASLGAIMLATSIWINMRRSGGWWNRMLATGATLVVFAWSMR